MNCEYHDPIQIFESTLYSIYGVEQSSMHSCTPHRPLCTSFTLARTRTHYPSAFSIHRLGSLGLYGHRVWFGHTHGHIIVPMTSEIGFGHKIVPIPYPCVGRVPMPMGKIVILRYDCPRLRITHTISLSLRMSMLSS